jgi:predicted CopG family antitoxin
MSTQKTIHISGDLHEILYNIKKPWQSYAEIIQEMTDMIIEKRVKEYQEKHGTEDSENIK